jgi:hypothetical protein
MTASSQILNIIGLVFFSWLVWVFYQIYLAAWSKDNAKERWLSMFATPLGLSIRPYFKWFILLIFSVTSFVLILLFINVLMQLTLIFMNDS